MSKPTYEELEKRVKELERANESMPDAEQHWKSLTQNSKAFIAIVDENGLIHFINKTTPPATPEDMIGKSVYNFMEGDYLDIFKKTLKKVFKTGST
ncbi:MAG: PAS domain S-box protein, partial [bacterium]|nr:PAS domain S-box protein [bacterium]